MLKSKDLSFVFCLRIIGSLGSIRLYLDRWLLACLIVFHLITAQPTLFVRFSLRLKLGNGFVKLYYLSRSSVYRAPSWDVIWLEQPPTSSSVCIFQEVVSIKSESSFHFCELWEQFWVVYARSHDVVLVRSYRKLMGHSEHSIWMLAAIKELADS